MFYQCEVRKTPLAEYLELAVHYLGLAGAVSKAVSYQALSQHSSNGCKATRYSMQTIRGLVPVQVIANWPSIGWSVTKRRRSSRSTEKKTLVSELPYWAYT